MAATVILVVDNDDGVRRSLRRFLTVHGYEVYEASDRDSALGQIRRRRPDVVILDLHMPPSSGLQIARELRADPTSNRIALIAFSASVPDWDEHFALLDRVIEKPAPAEVLLDAIRESTQRAKRKQGS